METQPPEFSLRDQRFSEKNKILRSHTSKNLLNLNAPCKLKGKVKKMEILPKTNQTPWVVIDEKEKKEKNLLRERRKYLS